MGCFLVPATEAVVSAIATKIIEYRENKHTSVKLDLEKSGVDIPKKTPFSHKLKWLTSMLSGGSILLALEHLWHGELMLSPPFLTAATNAADTKVMIEEMSTVGVMMAALVTAVWLGMVCVSSIVEKKNLSDSQVQKNTAKEVM
jgi:hypothetical protein